jgi:hypothetical protein
MHHVLPSIHGKVTNTLGIMMNRCMSSLKDIMIFIIVNFHFLSEIHLTMQKITLLMAL